MVPTFNFFCFFGLYFWLFTLYLVFYFWLFKFGTWLFSCDFISGVFSLWSFAFAISLGVRSSIACWPGKSLTIPLPLPRLQFLLFAFLYFCPVFISFAMLCPLPGSFAFSSYCYSPCPYVAFRWIIAYIYRFSSFLAGRILSTFCSKVPVILLPFTFCLFVMYRRYLSTYSFLKRWSTIEVSLVLNFTRNVS